MRRKRILMADLGSTITKVGLFEHSGYSWSLIARAESKTTIQMPILDATVGVVDAVQKLEGASGIRLIFNGSVITPASRWQGVDIFATTSSAGGGLRMIVAGVVDEMSTATAHKAAAGAGAIVLKVLSAGNVLTLSGRLREISDLKPDIVLLAGGTEGGNCQHVAALAEAFRYAGLEPRYGGKKLPVVFAGNSSVRDTVSLLLGNSVELWFADNILPHIEIERVEHIDNLIHQLFLSHVVEGAPGYSKLLGWCDKRLLPTPSMARLIIEQFGKKSGKNVMLVDIGGSTTDIVSNVEFYRGRLSSEGFGGGETCIRERKVHSSVSANLGMSYSLANTLLEAGEERVMRWLPGDINIDQIYDWCFNKRVYPHELPTSDISLMIEQGLAREALRMAFAEHQDLARKPAEVVHTRSIARISESLEYDVDTLVQRRVIDLIVGAGGVLANAPLPIQAMQMIVDGICPEGITEILLDNQRILPLLGSLLLLEKRPSRFQVTRFLAPLGTTVAPVGEVRPWSRKIATVMFNVNGNQREFILERGKQKIVPVAGASKILLKVFPTKYCDVGAGMGQPVKREVITGVCGLLLDGRIDMRSELRS